MRINGVDGLALAALRNAKSCHATGTKSANARRRAEKLSPLARQSSSWPCADLDRGQPSDAALQAPIMLSDSRQNTVENTQRMRPSRGRRLR
jgi:hypothetical protein